jgi:hypothetical protein
VILPAVQTLLVQIVVISLQLGVKNPRLRRLMCGRPLAFRQTHIFDQGYAQFVGQSPKIHSDRERKRKALPHIGRQAAGATDSQFAFFNFQFVISVLNRAWS